MADGRSDCASRAAGGDTGRSSQRLLDVALRVVGELDLDSVLDELLGAAKDLTGARFAALGVLNEDKTALERFLTAGVDEGTRRRIGPLPTGKGVLGELIRHPSPLRLAEVGEHPRSYGFPAGHPPMRTFLGVPILIAGVPFGNIYLAEKAEGLFDEEDERALVALAAFAGAGIDHARRYAESQAQSDRLSRAVAALDASEQISRALGSETELDAVLQLVAKRGRALVGARAVVLEVLDGDELVIAAGAGELPPGLIGQRVGLEGTVASVALETRTTQRLDDPRNRRRFEEFGIGRRDVEVRSGLVIPLVFRGRRYGAMLALDHLESDAAYGREEQQLLEAFAASAATALATAHSVTVALARHRIAAVERERARWARELRDETLLGLASMRPRLAAILEAGGWDEEGRDAPGPRAVLAALAQVDADIAGLESLIAELHPGALGDLGIEVAIRALCDRAAADGFAVELNVNLAGGDGDPRSHDGELVAAVSWIAQEAIVNAREHGRATRVQIDIEDDDTALHISITDDGDGFDQGAVPADRFGLHVMHERADGLGGRLSVHSAIGQGTRVRASLPHRDISAVQPGAASG